MVNNCFIVIVRRKKRSINQQKQCQIRRTMNVTNALRKSNQEKHYFKCLTCLKCDYMIIFDKIYLAKTIT